MTDAHTPCVEWTKGIDRYGYGRCGKNSLAHRVEWVKVNGPIPEGMVIDHLCRNRRCVNVLHMEIVTNKENILRGEGFGARNSRKTHCLRGHSLSGDNLKITKGGKRECVTCRRAKWRNYRRRQIDKGLWNSNGKPTLAKLKGNAAWSQRANTGAVDELVKAAEQLANAERAYRLCHDMKGDGHSETGRAWDHMRKSGDSLRNALAALEQKP